MRRLLRVLPTTIINGSNTCIRAGTVYPEPPPERNNPVLTKSGRRATADLPPHTPPDYKKAPQQATDAERAGQDPVRSIKQLDRSWTPKTDELPRGAVAGNVNSPLAEYARPPGPEGAATTAASVDSETDKWWPKDPRNSEYTGRVMRGRLDSNRKLYDGMSVPEMKQMPDPQNPEHISFTDDHFLSGGDMYMVDECSEEQKRWIPPPTFDPALDDINDDMHNDPNLLGDILDAAESDRRRLEQFSNPITIEDQVDYLLQPQRQEMESQLQRDDFNGFVHWGLLHCAHMAIEENKDYAKAHSCVNRYMRDIDLFVQWTKHPKVVRHLEKKFGVSIAGKFDKLMGLAVSMYTRGKVQCYENDIGGSLKSLTASIRMVSEGGDLTNMRHKRIMGAALAARGMIFFKLDSLERSESDLTKCLDYVAANRAASVYQLRAEVRERLGRLDEARSDEITAADIWENADTISTGLDGEPRKFVL